MAAKPDNEESRRADDTAGWRSMLGGMTMLGGAQAVQVGVQLLRAKCVALLLGPSGMGVSALLASSAAVLQQAGAAGSPGAVAREMSLAHGNDAGESVLACASRRFGACLAVASALACMLLSVPLSVFTLGSGAYAWQYVFVAGAVGFGIQADIERSMLQGRRRTGHLAWATCCSASLGLAIGVPMYWAWAESGISPAMMALAACMWAFYRWGNRGIRRASLSRAQVWAVAKPLLKFGVALMGAQLLGALVLYAQNVYIRMAGDASDVGMWQASASICTQAAAMVFAAMAMDYYPRLTRAMMGDGKAALVLRRQTRLVALVAAPLVIMLALCSPLIVRMLLSSEFDSAVQLVRLLGVGVFFQAISYPGGYVTLASGNKRLFFWLEGVGFNTLQLALACIGYSLAGLTGVGVAYISLHAVSMVIYSSINRSLYGLCYTRGDILLLSALSMAVVATALIAE